MKPFAIIAVSALAVGAAVFGYTHVFAPPSGPTDFLTVGKVVCALTQTVTCVEGKCNATPADDRMTAAKLIFDFRGQRYAERKGIWTSYVGTITDDRVSGDTRSFWFGEHRGAFENGTIDKAGKFTIHWHRSEKEQRRGEGACEAD